MMEGGGATVSFVDVGQGDCTLAVDGRTGDGLLVDCPTGSSGRAIAELRALGVRRLVGVVISHSHEDHFGGVLEVVEGLGGEFTGDIFENHETLMAVPVAGDARKVAGRKVRALINRLREYPGRVHKGEAGGAHGIIGRMEWRLLAPTYDDVLAALGEGDPNLASGVVVIELNSSVVVVGGDAQLLTWEKIARFVPRQAVLRFPHHGGSIGPEPGAHAWLLDKTDPSTVVVSVGTSNTHGHPTTAFFDAAAQHGSRLLCTQATSSCVLSGRSPSVCAGTVRVDMETIPPTVVSPGKPQHDAIVEAYGAGQCRRQEYPGIPTSTPAN